MILSTCGLKCDECEFFTKTCTGCRNVQGSTFWAKEVMADKTCPLYSCAVYKHGYYDCGDCPDLPCATFVQMKDPAVTDEKHQQMIEVRIGLLRERAR